MDNNLIQILRLSEYRVVTTTLHRVLLLFCPPLFFFLFFRFDPRFPIDVGNARSPFGRVPAQSRDNRSR